MITEQKLKITYALLIFLSSVVPAFPLTQNEAQELVKYVDEVFYPLECKSIAIMKNNTGKDRQTENKLEIWRKGNMMLAIFLSPPIQKGQKFLRNGDDMWMYLPKSKRVTRISAKERSMGGEASNADVMRVDLVKDYTVSCLGEETINDKACYKLELTGKDRRVAYHKIVYWISKDKLPVKRELYSISGKLMKNIYFDDITNVNGINRPVKMIIENAIDKTFRTEMIWLEVDDSARYNNNIFTPDYLKNL